LYVNVINFEENKKIKMQDLCNTSSDSFYKKNKIIDRIGKVLALINGIAHQM